MKPYYESGAVQIFHGDCRDVLKELPSESVHCVVTSPPYWGLRDYGTATWHGGDLGCDHSRKTSSKTESSTLQSTSGNNNHEREGWRGGVCGKCGATCIDSQLGLEKNPETYIQKMVEVFHEVKRVLRSDGTLWLNMGDSYNAHPGQRTVHDKAGTKQLSNRGSCEAASRSTPEMKAKDLCGIPWMLAFALRADGWYLRSDIIWHKPNPMPESVTDRPTKAHEYIFLLSKSERYFYDQEAIREAWSCDRNDMREKGVRTGTAYLQQSSRGYSNSEKLGKNERLGKRTYAGFNGRWDEAEANGELQSGRNKRTVWTVPTSPFPDAHFATFPPDLIKPCILAGCCRGGVVLDPFFGAGTTGLVSQELHCRCIGIELNKEYIEIAAKRLEQQVFSFG